MKKNFMWIFFFFFAQFQTKYGIEDRLEVQNTGSSSTMLLFMYSLTGVGFPCAYHWLTNKLLMANDLRLKKIRERLSGVREKPTTGD